MKGKEEKKKTARELKEEFFETRSKEVQDYQLELDHFLQERNIDLGSRTITEEGGHSRNEIYIIDKL